jgi:hypothetical protein
LRRRERERERDQLGEAHIRAAGRERRSVEVKQVTGMTKRGGMWGWCRETARGWEMLGKKTRSWWFQGGWEGC